MFASRTRPGEAAARHPCPEGFPRLAARDDFEECDALVYAHLLRKRRGVEHYPAADRDHRRELSQDEAVARQHQPRLAQTELRVSGISGLQGVSGAG